MFAKSLLYILAMCISVAAVAQDAQPAASKEAFQKEYQRRIKQTHLDQVYIPSDLGDAFVQLNKLIDTESKEKFKNLSEEAAARRLFFSLGRWIMHNWSFYDGSRLSHYLRELGISHPEDMAQFIIISYHRNLNRQPLDVKSQIEFYQEKRRKETEERLQKAKIIHEETRPATKGQ